MFWGESVVFAVSDTEGNYLLARKVQEVSMTDFFKLYKRILSVHNLAGNYGCLLHKWTVFFCINFICKNLCYLLIKLCVINESVFLQFLCDLRVSTRDKLQKTSLKKCDHSWDSQRDLQKKKAGRVIVEG